MSSMQDFLREYRVEEVCARGSVFTVRARAGGAAEHWVAGGADGIDREGAERQAAAGGLAQRPLLRYRGALLHAASHTLFLLREPTAGTLLTDVPRPLSPSLLWRLLSELARAVRALSAPEMIPARRGPLVTVISPDTVWLSDDGEVRLEWLRAPGELVSGVGGDVSLMSQVADTVSQVGGRSAGRGTLGEVLRLLKEPRATPDVVLRHPVVLAQLDLHAHSHCADTDHHDDPLYANLPPSDLTTALVPLAPPSPPLQLPGYVPRGARAPPAPPLAVSQRTLSEEWMSRMAALRRREESLNTRERQLVSREIAASPPRDSRAGITLPAVTNLRPRHRPVRRRSRSLRPRPRRPSYPDLDSSLSADQGGETECPPTAARLPGYRPGPRLCTKQVERAGDSDDSVTLTFYELQSPRRDVSLYKYLDDTKKAGPALLDITNTRHTRSSARLSLAPVVTAQVEPKKSKRRSLLPSLDFKAPFKFMSSRT